MKYWLYSSYFKSFQEYVYFMSFYDKKVRAYISFTMSVQILQNLTQSLNYFGET